RDVMCLLAVAWRVSDRYPFAVAANRDERHSRPTLAVHWWHDHPHVFGGRDMTASGSWLAVDRRGRLAAVTNLRQRSSPPPAPRSRGRLVSDFLAEPGSAANYAATVEAHGSEYAPVNLLLFDGETLLLTSNRAAREVLGPGVHAVGNAPLDAVWPKFDPARDGLRAALEEEHPTEAVLEMLADRGPVNGDLESALFIDGAEYG